MENNYSNAQRAEVLTQALPYIKRYNGKIVVIKYGGNAMINETLKQQVMEDIVPLWLIGVKVVLVHGGGPEITDIMSRLGKKAEFVDGLRVTDKETVDIVGRYRVTINGRTYDTVCVMDIGHFNHRIAIEQYLDQNGRTILWRRFNKNDWAFSRYGKLWTELLPDNERLTVNGETYVHWYDCITSYIL